MTRDDVIDAIRERTGLGSDEAARAAAEATLRTLGERVPGARARAVADGLPEVLAEPLRGSGESAEAFGIEEFLDRVDGREGDAVDGRAAGHAGAVIDIVSERADPAAWRTLREGLPEEYRRVFGDAPPERDVSG